MKITNLQQNIIRNLPFRAEKQVEQKSSDKEAISFAKKHKDEKFSFPVLATTIAGTIIPMLFIRKKQGLNLKNGTLKNLSFLQKAKAILKSFDIKYEMPEMIMTASGSVLGGLAGGLLFDKNKDKHNKMAKIKEFVFQMFNVCIPILIGDQAVKFAEKKNWKGNWVKVAAPIIAIGAGMPIAATISNTINNKIVDREHPETRKLRIKDAFVHVDDFAGVLILSHVPFADKLQRILPFLYGMCGYEAGTKQH